MSVGKYSHDVQTHPASIWHLYTGAVHSALGSLCDTFMQNPGLVPEIWCLTLEPLSLQLPVNGGTATNNQAGASVVGPHQK